MSQNAEPLGFSWSTRDLLVTLMIAFMGFSVMVFAMKQKDDGRDKDTLSISILWDKNSAVDVDLHIRTPEDQDIYYNNTHGKDCDLVHDDLGSYADPTSRQIEIAYCRKPVAGHYLVNAEVFSGHGGIFPVHVQLFIRDSQNTIVARGQGVLTEPGDEITLAQFDVDQQHKLIPASVNDLPDYFVTHKAAS